MSDCTKDELIDGGVVSEDEFIGLVSHRSANLLAVLKALAECEAPAGRINRQLIARILSNATQLVELLDRYGAHNNQKWRVFRLLTATIKGFAVISYEMHHILSVLPSYRLLPIGKDFVGATEDALAFSNGVIVRSGMEMLSQAENLSVTVPPPDVLESPNYVSLPSGVLVRDRPANTEADVSKTVTFLATAFLNVASECHDVRDASRAKPEDYASFIPDAIGEEKLRYLCHRLHNLQSLYDTSVSDSQTERLDENLPVLRGHISVGFHLLTMATSLIHYYERHVDAEAPSQKGVGMLLVDPTELLAATMSYSVMFAGAFIDAARTLCQDMLKSYAEIGEIELPIPRYRGFHVRPSTLVAKIVLYYGSDVQLKLNGHCYDASTPLEIFRANETINARKRQWLASVIADHPAINGIRCEDVDVMESAHEIVMDLATCGKMVIYAKPLVMRDVPVREGGTLLECVIDEIAHLQATGKIDINVELTIGFKGDKRVLDDLKLLAEHGYGEDNLGVDIVLPSELAYLRR
ncbi:MAG: hypothetical protein HN350_08785 [Phycisphaerales bacterium]|jgi:hypothetical protein|nr:hypothetical protein [Phycisphaerales bacterium]